MMMPQEKSELLVVRLPLTEKDRRTAAVAEQGVPADIALVFAAVARALGTPVPDGDLETVGWVHPLHLQELLNSSDREKFAVTSKARVGSRDIALTQQSDADVLIAALRVEIKRLSEELAREEKAQCEIIKERDDAEDALSRMYQSVMGEPPEWSSGFGFESAISDTEEYVQVLRQRARTIATQPVYQYRVGSYWMDTTKIFFDARVQAGQETRTLHKEIQPPSGRTEGQGDE